MVKKEPKRRAWRKAKIEDVEDANEDDRLVKRLKSQGGGKKRKGAPVDGEEDEADAGEEEAGGDELFTVDTAGSSEGISMRQRRIIARERLFPTKPERLGMSAAEAAKVERAEKRLPGVKLPSRPKGPEVFDLWGAPATANTAASSKPSEDFLCIRARKYLPHSVPGTVNQKVGKAPAVVPAHEGQSANPEASAYEDLACTAAARELEREQAEEELDRKIRPLTHSLRDLAGPEALKGLSDAEKVELYRKLMLKERAEDEAEDISLREGRGGHEKSQAQKNRKKKQKVKEEHESQKAQQRRLEKSVGEVGALLKELKAEDDIVATRKQYRSQLAAEKLRMEREEGVVPRRRRLGRTNFVERALVVPDADTARKGFRAARLKGSAIHERLSSIMRRGMLPAPPEASRSEAVRHGKRNVRKQKMRKYISPLLRDGTMLK